MTGFIQELQERNLTLYYFGLCCFLFAMICLILTKCTITQVYGVNAWFKPFKFAFSTFLYAWAMAWYNAYLPKFNTDVFNWTVILLLGFEIVYISWMAGHGKLSHYNTSTPFYAAMFFLMAFAATVVTMYTAYIGFLFFIQSFPSLPDYYLWAIRAGIAIFVVFSLEGFVMGSRLSHTVGAVNDNSDWFIVGWSKTVGDLRVAHFIGMHALQVLPILSFYVFRNCRITMLVSILYGLLAFATLVQALQGKPVFNSVQKVTDISKDSKEP